MSNNKKISIITVCYNAEANIEETVQSVVEQTYSNIEYIIVDGKSTDKTVEIINRYLDRNNIIFSSERDSGIYNAMNKGIAKACGDYVLFLNAGDTLYEKETIEKVVNEIKSDEDYIYHGMVSIKSKLGMPTINTYEYENKDFWMGLSQGQMPCHQSIIAPLDSLRRHYFNENYKFRADYEWVMYSYIKGWKYRALSLIVSNYDGNGVTADLNNLQFMRKETQVIQEEYQSLWNIKETKDKPDIINYGKMNNWEEMSDKHLRMFMLANKWLLLYQNKKHIESYFKMHNYKKIAIYGMGYIGERLFAELNNSSVKVEYIIDKKNIKKECEIEIIRPSSFLNKVDAIIVTSIYYYEEIKANLQKSVDYPIISMEEIIEELL